MLTILVKRTKSVLDLESWAILLELLLPQARVQVITSLSLEINALVFAIIWVDWVRWCSYDSFGTSPILLGFTDSAGNGLAIWWEELILGQGGTVAWHVLLLAVVKGIGQATYFGRGRFSRYRYGTVGNGALKVSCNESLFPVWNSSILDHTLVDFRLDGIACLTDPQLPSASSYLTILVVHRVSYRCLH